MRLATILAAFCAAWFAVAFADQAAAATIEYTITGTASGMVQDGGVTTPFNKMPFTLHVFGNTNTFVSVGADYGVFLIGARLSSPVGSGPLRKWGGAYSFYTNPLPERPWANGLFGDSTHFTLVLGGPQFAGYDTISPIGPFTTYESFFLDDLQLRSGADLVFRYVPQATFQASLVPEPATWAMMALGLAGLGAALRRSRFTRRGAPAV